MKVGVIGVQGAVSEHIDMLRRCNADAVWIREKKQLDSADALIIPGGESTTISRLMTSSGFFESVQEAGRGGLPIYGTCAGLILLAKKGDGQVEKTWQRLLGLMDMEICRNAFGRQRESFEAEIDIDGIGKYNGVFIRAPAIKKVWGKCAVLSSMEGHIIAAQQDNLLATSFHPELAGDLRVHKLFLGHVKQ